MLTGAVLKPPPLSDPLSRIDSFRSALCEWFEAEGKDYPWRRTRDPWAILVAEVMLQQTQIATVLGRGFYVRFLEKFPTAATFAAASESELLKVWEGLGYYRRARMLQAAAREVVASHGGQIPRDPADILKLPGVGRYTAGAVASFAFDLPAPIVDGNVARVLARLMDFPDEIDSAAGQRQLWEWAEALVDPERPRTFNSALMELGQRICRPEKPQCLDCPVAGFCLAAEPDRLPRKKPARAMEEVIEHVAWRLDPDRGLLLQQENGARRKGLWKLPERSAAEVAGRPRLLTQRYGITRYKVTMHVHEVAGEPRPGETWQPLEEIPRLAMPSPFRRAVEELLAGRVS